jgi:hypothetical protein
MRLPKSVYPEGISQRGFFRSFCPYSLTKKILKKYDKSSKRIRLLPATFIVYLIICLALWRDPPQEEVLRIVCEGLKDKFPTYDSSCLPDKSAICKARVKLGPEVMRELAERVMTPIAPANAPGAWYRGLRLVSLDGSLFNLPDSKANAEYFGYPGASRGEAAFPQLRLLGLIETGSHLLIAAEAGPYKLSEQKMTATLIEAGKMTPGMLVLADRNFYGYRLWKKANETGASLLWRVKLDLNLQEDKRYPDGSYLSTIFDSKNRTKCVPIFVRVVEYNLKSKNKTGSNDVYRLITNLLDYEKFPANELAALYHERWEIENLFSELKISLEGNKTVIRSKSPDLVFQDIWGLIIMHYGVRRCMALDAWEEDLDPDILSFKGAVHVLRRKLPQTAAFSPKADESLVD